MHPNPSYGHCPCATYINAVCANGLGCCPKGSGSERLQLALFGELAKGAAFELSHTLGGEARAIGHLAQRQRVPAANSEAKFDDLAGARVKALEGAADRLLLESERHLLHRARAVCRNERAQFGLA